MIELHRLTVSFNGASMLVCVFDTDSYTIEILDVDCSTDAARRTVLDRYAQRCINDKFGSADCTILNVQFINSLCNINSTSDQLPFITGAEYFVVLRRDESTTVSNLAERLGVEGVTR